MFLAAYFFDEARWVEAWTIRAETARGVRDRRLRAAGVPSEDLLMRRAMCVRPVFLAIGGLPATGCGAETGHASADGSLADLDAGGRQHFGDLLE